MSYAVLFKIYFYDDFVARQLGRLKEQVGAGDLYVVADETRGSLGPIAHDKVIRVTETDLVARGFARGPEKHSIFWYSADYSVIYAFLRYPDYDYYVTIEYDAVVHRPLDRLVASVAESSADYVGLPIDIAVSQWAWRKTCDELYEPAAIRPYLDAIAFHSRRGVELLRDRRLELSAQLASGQIRQWPISEAFNATETLRAGYVVRDLSDFGDVSHFDWWPPSLESELPELASLTFVHPVLTGERYLDSLLRQDQVRTLFAPDSPLAKKLRSLPPADYVPKLMPKLINRGRKSPPPFVLEMMKGAVYSRPNGAANIALGKPATQSSVSAYSRNPQLAEDAAGAVNGVITGTFGFHTGLDDPPWWMVDLEIAHRLSEILVFNRLNLPKPSRNLKILVSETGQEWREVYRRESEENFGGAYGEPLRVTFETPPVARFVRIELVGKQHLHLDQVEIFGLSA
jgi:hypothetical protein